MGNTANTISKSNRYKYKTVCFGGEDWWYHNRGHIDMQLMRRFARLGTTLYVNSIVMQKPSLKKNIAGGKSFADKLIRKTKSVLYGLRYTKSGFWVYTPFFLPVHHIACLRAANETLLRLQLLITMHKLGIRNPVVWVACPPACDVAIKMKKVKLVYQRTDRFEEYPNVDTGTIRQYDQKLKAYADLTIYASGRLFEQEKNQCKKALYLDHGVDFNMFATAEYKQEIPADIANIRRPIVGFFGGIHDHIFDVDFIERVVDMLPGMSFIFIGSVSSDCSSLSVKKNVRMLGQKPYEQIPYYGKCFDVVIMPWKQNRWIEACNPIKLKEYLALGKPVVSTPFPELQTYRDVVYEAKTPQEFANSIKMAYSRNRPELVAKRRQKVASASWDSKAELVLCELFREQESNTRISTDDST
jgi:glycosyltransferase involved in cell wall biosynthesis